MGNENYRPRLIEKEINDSLKTVGAVSVEGPKGCGKTWCARHLSKSEFSLTDPRQDYANRRIAQIDPSAVLEGDEPRLIDEWQDVPKIWDAVRFEVDREGRKGRFILCGSSSVDKGQIMHSGSLRISPVRMRTMSLYESGDSNGKISLADLFDGNFADTVVKGLSFQDIVALIVRGGWPGMLDAEPDLASSELSRYIINACEIDAQKIGGKRRNVRGMLRTMRSLARNESTMASKAKIQSDACETDSDPIQEETVDDYLEVFRNLFLIEDQYAFQPSYRSSLRVGKNPKRHLADPSLAVAALGLNTQALSSDVRTLGFLFEALCERDLNIYAQYNGGKLYHYRDYRDCEIDAVVEIPGRGWGAFEVKLGADDEDKAAKNLLRIRQMMENNGADSLPSFLCVLNATGRMQYRRDDGVYVVPISALGP